MMSRLRLGLLIALVIVGILNLIIMFGLQRFYYISAGLWLVTIMLLVAGISVKEREKKEASEINKT
jgi:hypothetical protein